MCFFLNGSCTGIGAGRGHSASWARVVFERTGAHYLLVGFRSGPVSLADDSFFFGGSQRNTNNIAEMEAFEHSLDWASALHEEVGEMLLVADNKYAIQAAQAMQRCSANIRLVHTVRRI